MSEQPSDPGAANPERSPNTSKEAIPFPGPSASYEYAQTGYAVWLYRGGSWDLIEDRSGEGYQPGPPPESAGLHEGYALRKQSIKATE